jgi:hypothetical protein
MMPRVLSFLRSTRVSRFIPFTEKTKARAKPPAAPIAPLPRGGGGCGGGGDGAGGATGGDQPVRARVLPQRCHPTPSPARLLLPRLPNRARY